MLVLVTNLEKLNELCRSVKADNEIQIYEMLVQCQENAIGLGNGLV